MILPILVTMFVCELIVSWISTIYFTVDRIIEQELLHLYHRSAAVLVSTKSDENFALFLYLFAPLSQVITIFVTPFQVETFFISEKYFSPNALGFFRFQRREISRHCAVRELFSVSLLLPFFYFIHYICTSFYTYIQWDGKYNICPNSFVVRSLRLRLWLKPVTENERRPNYTRNNIAPGIDLISWFLVRLQSIS